MSWKSILKASDFTFSDTLGDERRNIWNNPMHQDIDADAINRLSAKDRQKALQSSKQYVDSRGNPIRYPDDEEETRLSALYLPGKPSTYSRVSEDVVNVNLPSFGRDYQELIEDEKLGGDWREIKAEREALVGAIEEALASGKLKRNSEEFKQLSQAYKDMPKNLAIDMTDKQIIQDLVDVLTHEHGHEATYAEIKNAIEDIPGLTPEEKEAFRRYADEYAAYSLEYNDPEVRDDAVRYHSATKPWREILQSEGEYDYGSEKFSRAARDMMSDEGKPELHDPYDRFWGEQEGKQ
tara:strand:- start:412 stop:1293 length:882 start_codon:yes stop_codon:yes gene_type:complete